MTAFALTGAQRAFASQVRSIAADQLRPIAEAGSPGHVNRELIKAMGELGLLSRLFPGLAGDSLSREAASTDLCLLREALATQSTEAETALALQGLGAYPILQCGQEETVRRWLPAVAAGDAVAAFALTEPEAGSDAAALALRAEPDGDDWRLTGQKTWISNAPEADIYTVFARTTPGAGARGVGAFAVGMAQAALDAAVRHAGTRTAFGGPLKDQQAVSHLLAEMATRTEAARLLVYAAAAAYDAGEERISARSAMAKLFATEAAQFVVDAAVQIHGARALRQGHLLEHLYREVRAPRIYEGASEVQRSIIARELYR